MGREVRRVPPGWQHPRDASGEFQPLLEAFPYNAGEVQEGLAEGWLRGEPPHYNMYVMPGFEPGTATHYMMYETCSEGTPISPAFDTPEALARWLADSGASACGDLTASYESWLRVCQGGWAPTGVIVNGRFMSGVEGG